MVGRALAAGCLLATLTLSFRPTSANQPEPWPSYGNDVGGTRYSPLADIGPENVASLAEAWTYRTGDVSDGRGEVASTSAFELTPILVDGTLYLCTPFNRVVAHWALALVWQGPHFLAGDFKRLARQQSRRRVALRLRRGAGLSQGLSDLFF